MTSTDSGNLEQDSSRLYPVVEGSADSQSADALRQQEEWRAELKSTEEDITTLRQLLDSKLRRSAELRRKLGLTPMAEIKHDLQEGIKAVKDSPALQRTNETLRGFGAVMSQKWADLRNSQAMSNFGTAVTSAKDKMARSKTIEFIASHSPAFTSNGAPSNDTAQENSEQKFDDQQQAQEGTAEVPLPSAN